MNRKTPRQSRAAKLIALFGTASFVALSSTPSLAAAAGAVQAAPVEEILITGSLVRGTEAVGVPVTTVGEEEFLQTGAITISEMLQNIPSIEGNYSVNTVEVSGANRQRFQNAEIHGLGGQSTSTLLMINGRRHPGQGTNLENVDPSIIPALAIQRVDVLAAGASATYGSDAVAGVINVIMRRNYNGAITQFRTSISTDLGMESRRLNAAQLFGRTWDSVSDLGPGGLTVSYEWWDQKDVRGRPTHAGRPYLTENFEPFGFDDRTPLASSYPGVVSIGANSPGANPNSTFVIPTGGQAVNAQRGARYCTNCFNIPVGSGWNFGDQAPGPTTTWAAITSNKFGPTNNNLRSAYEFANMNPATQANFATLTFDQEVFEDVFGLGPVAVFADGYYMNRRFETTYPPGYSPSTRSHTVVNGVNIGRVQGSGNAATIVLNTAYPYLPTGTPANAQFRVHYSLGKEFPNPTTEGSISMAYSFGINMTDLPFGWVGKAYFHAAEEYSWSFMRNLVNQNMFEAALGNTIASQAASGSIPAHSAFTKPANVPYLNLFCDALVYRCNSTQTLNYIKAFRDDDSTYNIRQFGLNLDGPIIDLPFLGGEIRGAVGLERVTHHFAYRSNRNETAFHTELVSDARQYNKQLANAITGQVNIPIFGERNALPFVEGFMLELGYRVDDYYYLGTVVKTPKIAANWNVGHGFVARGAVGSSFSAPPFGLITNYVGYRERHAMVNLGIFGGGALELNCPAHADLGNVAGVAVPGSLQHYLNPLCAGRTGTNPGPLDPGSANTFNSLLTPIGISLGPSLFAIRGEPLEPETSDQWSLGFNFAPAPDDPFTGALAGLNIDVSWWHIQQENLIGSLNAGLGVNDPDSFDATQSSLANADPRTSRYIAAPRPDLLLTAPENASLKAIVDELIASGKAEIVPEAVPFIKFIDIQSDTNLDGWAEISGIDFDIRYDWDMGNWGAMGVGASGYYETRNRSQDGPGQPIDSSYTQVRRSDGVVEGANSGHQLQRMRFNVRYTDPMAHWNLNLGSTWRPHRFGGGTPPACFWRDDFGPGSAWATARGYVGCYPDSPFHPQPAKPATPANHVAVVDQRFEGQLQPSDMFFDLSIAYNTLDMPTNTYLQNIRFTLNVNNILNRLPSAIDYDARTASGSQRIREGNPMQRTVAFTITKNW